MEHDKEVSIMEKKTYALYSKDEFMRIYEDVTSDKKLLAVLVEMQTRLGIHEQKAWENASQLVGEVVQFEATKDRMLEEPECCPGRCFPCGVGVGWWRASAGASLSTPAPCAPQKSQHRYAPVLLLLVTTDRQSSHFALPHLP